MAKTYQSINKRFRVTKKKKIMHKSNGLNHFRSKKSGHYIISKRRSKKVPSNFRGSLLKILK